MVQAKGVATGVYIANEERTPLVGEAKIARLSQIDTNQAPGDVLVLQKLVLRWEKCCGGEWAH